MFIRSLRNCIEYSFFWCYNKNSYIIKITRRDHNENTNEIEINLTHEEEMHILKILEKARDAADDPATLAETEALLKKVKAQIERKSNQ